MNFVILREPLHYYQTHKKTFGATIIRDGYSSSVGNDKGITIVHQEPMNFDGTQDEPLELFIPWSNVLGIIKNVKEPDEVQV